MVGTRADRGETGFSNPLSAGRQQRTKMKREERKSCYVEQSLRIKEIYEAIRQHYLRRYDVAFV
jgi:hypothetical protein